MPKSQSPKSRSKPVKSDSKPDFKSANKAAADSFAAQRRMIMDICRGKAVNCPDCQKPLIMIGPGNAKDTRAPGIYCAKGCTAIELDFAG